MGKILDRLFNAGILRHWRRVMRAAEQTPLTDLRSQRNQARTLRGHLDQLIHIADGRLALPRIGSSYFPRPHGTDWSWRPELWRGPLQTPGLSSAPNKSRLGTETTLFHDCEQPEVILHQLRNRREQDLAPYGLRMEVFGFDGSFLSLVIDLPAEAAAGLNRSHLLRVDMIIQTESPLQIFARLNIRHGPNTDQQVRELRLGEKESWVEFDLAYFKVNEKRIERLWLDVIFDSPEMNQVILHDLTFARHRRAAL